MNKITLVLIVLAVVLVGWYFMSSKADAPSETIETPATQTAADTTVEHDGMEDMDSGAGDSEVPAVADAPADAVVINTKGFNYGYDISEIKVKEGDTVVINFESSEGFHDWVVDEFNAATDRVRPGTPTSVTFVADKQGTYEFYCSVGSHRAQGMVGTLIVE